MTRARSVAATAGILLSLAISSCGGSPTASAPASGAHWWPSTPLPTPGVAGTSVATPSAAAPSLPPSVGQSGSKGLGTPAATVSATAQLTFDPGTVSLKANGVIQWTNTGSVPHNVTFDAHQDLSSGTLQQGDTWQVQFTAPGTYAYHCTFHPGMNGQVTVTG